MHKNCNWGPPQWTPDDTLYQQASAMSKADTHSSSIEISESVS